MKRAFQNSLLFPVVLITFIFICAPAPYILAQSCQNPPTQDLITSFPQYSTVNFYIEPSFSSDQKKIIRSELNSWSLVGVAFFNFNEVFDVGDLGNPFIHGANPTMQFIRGTPTPSSAQASLSGQAFYGCRATAFVTINLGVTNNTAFSHVVSHELGHLFALADCTTCPPGSTAMTLPQTPDLTMRISS
jgi:hypothetical protein